MALLKDQPISCLSEWMAYDTKLSILSEQESTSIEAKSRLAQNEIETQVTSFLLRQSGLGDNAARQLLNRVVVTEALTRWHSLLTLSLFYVDLAALQSSTLHRDQARYYEFRAESAREQLFDTGIGIVNNPVPKAPVPTLVISNGNNPHRFLRARARYVDIDGAVGAVSDEFLIDMTDGQDYQLSIATLPQRVAGWHLFVGETSEKLTQATTMPVTAAAVISITPDLPAPGAPLLDRAAQQPDRFIRVSNELWR